jgi:tetratricopeptide (TPR) repeat protein
MVVRIRLLRFAQCTSVVFFALLAGACATGAASSAQPVDLPALEARFRADSSSAATRLELARGYREAGQAQRASALVEPVVRADSSDALATLELGLAYEDLNRLAAARALYERFLRTSPSGETRRRLQERLRVLARLELRDAVRASLARERELQSRAPSPRTVGVFPFLFAGSDSSLRPLGRAFADLLTTDLAQTDRLRVLERAQLQYLTDEIRLTQSGYTDPATAVRAGRILSAAHIVQGRIDGATNNLGVQALVVATAVARDSTANVFRQQGGLARLFDMEKEIALTAYSRLGIQLTAAERQRVNRRATENVQALIAFGFGLEAEDAGRYAEAANHYRRAAQLDPGFVRAQQRAAETQAWGETMAFTTRQLGRLAAPDLDGSLSTWQRQQLSLDVLESLVPVPQVRDPTVEFLGTEGLGSSPGIEIIIRRPVASGASLRPGRE